ncbi:unnamed protein product [Moneuplotes crassus]|uniref:Uncharacterized protein n=1 Tax=Euplotes crassus TaxID=5936 RepID=A0AAD1XCA6_EUPCR|nr:unnamed protein product [Moneuplotes crassus]
MSQNPNPSFANEASMLQRYNDRMHMMMFPNQNQKMPKMHDYLNNGDIKESLPNSLNSKLRGITGRDYMNIKDIDGVVSKPNFIQYKSKHKDFKLDISDIAIKSPQKIKQQLMVPKDPLNPRYVRLTESRRHVQVYGEIEGGKPKKTIAPRTRRQTNMVEDIIGKKKPNSHYYSNNNAALRKSGLTTNTCQTNPITGEEVKVNINLPKPVSFLKENHAEKSRRLQRILNNFENHNRSTQENLHLGLKNSLEQGYYKLNTRPRMEASPTQDLASKRKMQNFSEVKGRKQENLLHSSKEFEHSVLPSFSKRKMGRKLEDFSAYDEIAPKSKPIMTNRSRHDLHHDLKKGSNSFNSGDFHKIAPSPTHQSYLRVSKEPMSKRIRRPADINKTIKEEYNLKPISDALPKMKNSNSISKMKVHDHKGILELSNLKTNVGKNAGKLLPNARDRVIKDMKGIQNNNRDISNDNPFVRVTTKRRLASDLKGFTHKSLV